MKLGIVLIAIIVGAVPLAAQADKRDTTKAREGAKAPEAKKGMEH